MTKVYMATVIWKRDDSECLGIFSSAANAKFACEEREGTRINHDRNLEWDELRIDEDELTYVSKNKIDKVRYEIIVYTLNEMIFSEVILVTQEAHESK